MHAQLLRLFVILYGTKLYNNQARNCYIVHCALAHMSTASRYLSPLHPPSQSHHVSAAFRLSLPVGLTVGYELQYMSKPHCPHTILYSTDTHQAKYPVGRVHA